MRRCFMFAFLLLSVASEPQSADQQLKVRAEIKSQRYCEVDEEILSLRVTFRIGVINTRSSAVLVGRQIPVVLVSRSLDDLRNGKHEFEINPPDVFPQPRPSREAIQKGLAERSVVQPGEKFETEAMETVLPTAKTEHYSKLEALGPGGHWVQVVILVNDESTGTFLKAVSQPMKVTVDQYPKTEKCE